MIDWMAVVSTAAVVALFGFMWLSCKITDWAFDERQRGHEAKLKAVADAKQAFWNRLNTCSQTPTSEAIAERLKAMGYRRKTNPYDRA